MVFPIAMNHQKEEIHFVQIPMKMVIDEDEFDFGSNPNDGDADGDGLSDLEEQEAGTNPNLKDTDGDGVSDDGSLAYGGDPLDASVYPKGSYVGGCATYLSRLHYGCLCDHAGTCAQSERGKTMLWFDDFAQADETIGQSDIPSFNVQNFRPALGRQDMFG